MILASASPRRSDILSMMGLQFRVEPSGASEALEDLLPPEDHVLEIARRKALTVAGRNPDAIVLGADTVVALDSEILEKPTDEADAIRMLTQLSGKTHHVYTGVALTADGGERILADVAATTVSMRAVSHEEIAAYVGTGEPMDKAGAYAAQGRASVFIQSISGCFFNVVGLPISLVWAMLGQILGCSPWSLVEMRVPPRGP